MSQLAVTSDGDRIESPQFLRKSEEKLKRKQRAVAKKKRGSNRRRKAVRELAGLHEKVANQRIETSLAKRIIANPIRLGTSLQGETRLRVSMI